MAKRKTPLHRIRVILGQIILVAFGVLLASFGIKGFLLSNQFIDGGVVGISMLSAKLSQIPLPLIITVINIPFVWLGLKEFGLRFALKSSLGILALALCLGTIHFPNVTHDALLSAVFGGFFIGAGIGLAIRGGTVLDGTEIAALIISKASHLLRVGDVILIFNIFIFGAAFYILGPESALYSILTYLSAAKTVNFLIHGIEEYTGITIISPENGVIKDKIIQELKKTVTVYRGYGGVSETEQDVLYCVVSKWEMGDVRNAAHEIDPDAFIVVQPLADVEGKFIKKPAFH